VNFFTKLAFLSGKKSICTHGNSFNAVLKAQKNSETKTQDI